jgi:hypothetical protein
MSSPAIPDGPHPATSSVSMPSRCRGGDPASRCAVGSAGNRRSSLNRTTRRVWRNGWRYGVDSPYGQLHGKDPQVAGDREETLAAPLEDYELIAQKLSDLSEKVSRLESHRADVPTRMADVEKVNARLEEAALTTARALGEISGHLPGEDRQVGVKRHNARDPGRGAARARTRSSSGRRCARPRRVRAAAIRTASSHAGSAGPAGRPSPTLRRASTCQSGSATSSPCV